jgi:hypothetical protein
MNKALSQESEDPESDEVRLPSLPLGVKNYITPKGYARIRGELLKLIDAERPKVVEIVHWAASNGDRSENGDYIYGKKRLREIDRQIWFFTKRLEIAEVIDPSVHLVVTKFFLARQSPILTLSAWRKPSPYLGSMKLTVRFPKSVGCRLLPEHF